MYLWACSGPPNGTCSSSGARREQPGPCGGCRQRQGGRGTRESRGLQARISQKVAVSVVFVAAMFISIMDVTIVNVALPTIGREFSVSPTAFDSISLAF